MTRSTTSVWIPHDVEGQVNGSTVHKTDVSETRANELERDRTSFEKRTRLLLPLTTVSLGCSYVTSKVDVPEGSLESLEVSHHVACFRRYQINAIGMRY